MKGIFTVLVENKAGVLSHIAGLFARRGFNIDSLAVGETEDKTTSSMTIISSGDERIMEQIEKQLNKKIDVIKVRRFPENKVVTRELLMIKVAYTNATRSDIMQICNITGAHIADLAPKTMVIELTAKTSKVDRFIKLMQPFGIVEMIRTGAVALQREID
ncbi:MAG: acetolactate synthase small subunit [Lachnospiraceae bacterium]|jgi:acetolactate synthase-1/3 small subunit